MSDSARLLEILDYWHKVEFFIPFDLKQVLDNRDEWSCEWLDRQVLMREVPTSLWAMQVPEGRKITGFKLYLGVFEMNEIEAFARSLPSANEADSFDDAERTQLDGRSCIASITLNADGEPIFENVSVSTAPWAMGQATQYGLSALSGDAFAGARSRVGDMLANFRTERLRARMTDDDSPLPLNRDEVLELHRWFIEWAGRKLVSHLPVGLVQVLTKPLSKNADTLPAQANAAPRKPSESTDDIGEDETAPEEAPAIDILNSFYIEDIERCMASVREGNIPATMRSYLTPLDDAKRVDLYTARGRAAIIAALHPRRFNAGHWLEDASRKMSLMQQFAINSALDTLVDGGIFSVNGPPGTGKTTLLRDMFCDNVVRRARELAKLGDAADALATTATKVQIADRSVSVRALRQEFTGFEMVVASSNNAAVENISNDLPKRKQLGPAWRGMSYLQPVAHKIAAQNDQGQLAKLDIGDVPWGLISCVLGRRQNGWRFAQRFYFTPEEMRADPAVACEIRAWVAGYDGISFDAAKQAFLERDDAVRLAIEERETYADLYVELSATSEAAFMQHAQTAFDAADAVAQETAQASRTADEDVKAHETRLSDLEVDERLIDRSAPGLFSKLFRSVAARRHASDTAANAHAQREVRAVLAQCRKHAKERGEAMREANAELHHAHDLLNERRKERAQKSAMLAQFQERFAGAPLPKSLDALEADAVQIGGVWQDEAFAHLRSQLFAASLTLHEAWLADVSRKGRFGGNLLAINKLLSGHWPADPSHVPLIWQSLFMVVPVVSTTFASFARQFRHMGPGSIGWLFIDEAGQAVPQAAVGALWRAKRAMVVGDPLQIEPVFTVPTRLIDALAQFSAYTRDGRYSPAQTSVQRLADDANPYGTLVAVDAERPLWIGSPLRVHRRCADPMFTIANRIAYQEKMVFGLDSREPPEDVLGFGESAWVDMRGNVARKQVVPAQIDLVVEFVVRLCAKHRSLPALYVISPFKAIKYELQRHLEEVDWRGRTGEPAPKGWKKWCAERVGTVHTFQGKEERTVIFVLGADRHGGHGAAVWAASKPNLLNVALTRAQHRIFVIGDADLWGGLRHFDAAVTLLKITTPEAWLAST